MGWGWPTPPPTTRGGSWALFRIPGLELLLRQPQPGQGSLGVRAVLQADETGKREERGASRGDTGSGPPSLVGALAQRLEPRALGIPWPHCMLVGASLGGKTEAQDLSANVLCTHLGWGLSLQTGRGGRRHSTGQQWARRVPCSRAAQGAGGAQAGI